LLIFAQSLTFLTPSSPFFFVRNTFFYTFALRKMAYGETANTVPDFISSSGQGQSLSSVAMAKPIK